MEMVGPVHRTLHNEVALLIAYRMSSPTLFTAPVSLSHLESHLWEAANILRGPVDAADFKTYILK
jgi:hypothetical protein